MHGCQCNGDGMWSRTWDTRNALVGTAWLTAWSSLMCTSLSMSVLLHFPTSGKSVATVFIIFCSYLN